MDRLGGGISSALPEREEGRKCVCLDAFSFPLAEVCPTRRSLSHPSTLPHLALQWAVRVQIQLGMWGFIQRREGKASIADVCKVGRIMSWQPRRGVQRPQSTGLFCPRCQDNLGAESVGSRNSWGGTSHREVQEVGSTEGTWGTRNTCVHYCLPLAALDLLFSLHVIMRGLTFSPFSMKTRWCHSNQSQSPSQGDGQQLSLGSLKMSRPRESPSSRQSLPCVPIV